MEQLSLFQRIRRKHRHGVLLQEILDQTARRGVVFYPYYVSMEQLLVQSGGSSSDTVPCEVRLLTPADAPELESITLLKTRITSAGAVAARMKQARCAGTFVNGELVAYCWIGHDGLPIPGSGRQWLYQFEPQDICLFDVYVAPAYRGKRIAEAQRRFILALLAEQGVKRIFSAVLAFNNASRRYKNRFGVLELELRLYLHLRLWRLPGIDLRLWRKDASVPTPRLRLVAARPR